MEQYKIKFEDKEILLQEECTFEKLIIKYLNKDIFDVALCQFNNKTYELGMKIPKSGELKLINLKTREGVKAYSRTLQYIFIKATLDVFPKSKVVIEHSIGKDLFGEVIKENKLNKDDVFKIKLRMMELIKNKIPINKVKVKKEEAIKIFEDYKMRDKVLLLSQIDFEYVKLYELDGRYDYFYGHMASNTGIIKEFDLVFDEPGFLLRQPEENDFTTIKEFGDYKKLRKVFRETEKWLSILDIGEVGSLNDKIDNGDLLNLLMVSEALHEKKIANIADDICLKDDIKLILIAGPTSSGKTSFAHRLSIQLRVNGLVPVPISLDDYFVDREFTPKDESGEYDFETIGSVDLNLLNQQLSKILEGEEVEIPTFNFKKGCREWEGRKVSLPQNGVIILEGIHGLNPKLTRDIDEKNKFKIYISALTQLNLDHHNRIATTDVRRIRRIVRDNLSRGHSAEDTLKMWNKIKIGEQKNIFIYQEEADVMFNSTLVYELCVLKKYALEELNKISETSPIYSEVRRLKSFLGFFREIPVDIVQTNSILREFIGGSIFYKY